MEDFMNYKKIYITLGVTFLVGMVLFGIGTLGGARSVDLDVDFGNFEDFGEDLEAEGALKLSDVAAKDIKELYLDFGAGEVDVVLGDEFSVQGKGMGKAGYVKEIHDGYAYHFGGTKNDASISLFGNKIDLGNINFLKGVGEYTVVLPRDQEFSNVSIKVGAGEVDIEEIIADKITLEVAAGSLNAEYVEGKEETTVNVDVGEADVNDGLFMNLKADCNLGNLDMEGKIEGESFVECGMGNIDLNVNHERDYYDIHTDVDMGNIKIDGQKAKNKLDATEDSSEETKKATLEVECGMGNIDLKFR